MPRNKRCSDWALTTNGMHIQRLENEIIKMTKKMPDKLKNSLKNEECYNDLLQGKLRPISFKVDVELPNQESCLVFILNFYNYSTFTEISKSVELDNFEGNIFYEKCKRKF